MSQQASLTRTNMILSGEENLVASAALRILTERLEIVPCDSSLAPQSDTKITVSHYCLKNGWQMPVPIFKQMIPCGE